MDIGGNEVAVVRGASGGAGIVVGVGMADMVACKRISTVASISGVGIEVAVGAAAAKAASAVASIAATAASTPASTVA